MGSIDDDESSWHIYSKTGQNHDSPTTMFLRCNNVLLESRVFSSPNTTRLSLIKHSCLVSPLHKHFSGRHACLLVALRCPLSLFSVLIVDSWMSTLTNVRRTFSHLEVPPSLTTPHLDLSVIFVDLSLLRGSQGVLICFICTKTCSSNSLQMLL